MINNIIVRKRNAYTNVIMGQISLSSEYKIRRIDGLGPVKADVSTQDIATDAGSQLIGSRDGDRNIVMKIEFNPNYAAGSTVTSLRRKLYSLLMPQSQVELEFDVETVELQIPDGDFIGKLRIDGIVETHEPDIFAENPSVVISIICPYPYFRGQQGLNIHSLPTNNTVTEFNVPNEGTVPVGFVFKFSVIQNRPSGGWRLHGTDQNAYFGVVDELKVGDSFRVSTVKNDRYILRTRGGVTSSVLGFMTGTLNDMKLYPGDNNFRFNEAGWTSNRIIEYENVYGGL